MDYDKIILWVISLDKYVIKDDAINIQEVQHAWYLYTTIRNFYTRPIEAY
jgi:hypothetical protein